MNCFKNPYFHFGHTYTRLRGVNKMRNFAYYNTYRNPEFPQPVSTVVTSYPQQTITYPYTIKKQNENDERFGGFLVPFLAGAVVSAPFWYLGANNKAQQAYQQQMYYQQNQPYPMYYPYSSTGQTFPSYYPYPSIK